jgi:hypothetical protein
MHARSYMLHTVELWRYETVVAAAKIDRRCYILRVTAEGCRCVGVVFCFRAGMLVLVASCRLIVLMHKTFLHKVSAASILCFMCCSITYYLLSSARAASTHS